LSEALMILKARKETDKALRRPPAAVGGLDQDQEQI